MEEKDERGMAASDDRPVHPEKSAWVLALVVLLVGFAASYAVLRELDADAARMRRNAFEFRSDDAVSRIDTRLRRYAQLLRGAAAHAIASGLDQERFDAYTNALQLSERYPEIHAIGLAVAEDGEPRRARILFIHRSIGDAGAVHGTDLYAEPALAEASLRARATSSTALSGLLPAQANGVAAPPHFAVLVPFSGGPQSASAGDGAERASGWVFVEVSAYGMMHRLFGERLGDDREDVDIRIRDGKPGTNAPLLYGLAEPVPPAGALVANRLLSFGGRDWSVVVQAMPGFAGGRTHGHATLAAAASGGSTVLLASLIWLVATGRGRAQREAARMNRELVESESRLRDLNDDLERRVAARTRELESYAERLALTVETSNTGMWDWNLLSGQTHYSREWARQLGLEQEELEPSIEQWERHLHPEDRDRALAALQRLAAAPGGPLEMELRMRHRDGGFRTILCRAQSYADQSGKPVRVVGSHLDITERKRAEDGLVRLARELRHTWRQLSQVEENERRWIASELHDSIGSALTALNLNLTIVRERLPEGAQESLLPRLTDSIALLEETVETVRGLMAQLRPPVLDDYGLATALRWYVEQIGSRSTLDATFRLEGKDVRLPPDSEIALFRIAQGALANVMKHSGAKRVEVRMKVTPASVRLAIEDDGRGFVPELTHADLGSPHWGLVTMRERAQSIGGHCSIESSPGHGTRVVVEAPRTP